MWVVEWMGGEGGEGDLRYVRAVSCSRLEAHISHLLSGYSS